MRRVVQEALRAAYPIFVPVEIVAAQHGYSPRQVRRFWAAEKAAGRIADEPRPTGPIIIRRRPKPKRGCADLLAALQRAHGADDLRRFDDMPRATLQMEVSGFPPSASRLRDFAITKDAYSRALLNKRTTHVGN